MKIKCSKCKKISEVSVMPDHCHCGGVVYNNEPYCPECGAEWINNRCSANCQTPISERN